MWKTVHAMRGVTSVSFPHFWWKNHLSRSELILKTHHNHSLPRSKRELASFYRGRIVPASIDRKLVNNDDVPHGVAVDIFGPKKTIMWSQLWRNWVQEFLKDHFWFSYFPHSTRNLSGIYSVMKNDIVYPLIFLNPQVSIGWSQLWHNGVPWSLNIHSCFL